MSNTDHTAPDHLSNLAGRLQNAQDTVELVSYTQPKEFHYAVTLLAREVTALGRAVEWQQTVIDAQQQVITELKGQQQ